MQNVVTYDVVLGVSNPELLLKPGMTANARIITAEQENVLQVPLQALRFSPNGGDHERQGGASARRPYRQRLGPRRQGARARFRWSEASTTELRSKYSAAV